MDSLQHDVFFEIHKGNAREGPGSNESTRRAFEMLPSSHEPPRILDVGCGPGMQTRELARISGGHIIAIDNHQPFLDDLSESANKEEVADRIEIVNGSMFDLPFKDESFDMIWSEGAIYIIGFGEGLRRWRNLLKPEGKICVTEVSWLRADRPADLKSFWTNAYPAIQDTAGNVTIIRESGYDLISHFTLPASDWWDHYYNPIQARFKVLRAKYMNNPAAFQVLDEHEIEMNLFRRYGDHYGYVFYVMRKSAY